MPPRAQLRALVRGRAPRLDDQEAEDDGGDQEQHAVASAQSPALETMAATRPGATRAPAAAASTAPGEATSARSSAVEPPLGGELAASPLGERRVDAGPAVLERREGGFGGQFAAAHGEAEPVAGHRIDEAGGVARDQQSVDRPRPGVHGERAEDGRRLHGARAGESVAQQVDRRRFRGRRARPDRRAAESPGPDGSTTQTFARPPGSGATPM